MKCTNCGKKLRKKQAFCMECGAPAPEAPQKNKRKSDLILVCVLLIISLSINFALLIGNLKPTKHEGNGFDSPEEAVTAYMKALSKGDIDAMVSTFAIESYVENYDLEERIETTKAISMFESGLCFPNSSDYVRELNNQARIGWITTQIRNGYYVLLNAEIPETTMSFTGEDADDAIDDLIDQLSDPKFNKKLGSMRMGDILTAEDLEVARENTKKLYKRYEYLNADELYDLVIEFEFDGRDYYLFMLTAQYDGKWYNVMLPSPLGLWSGLHANSGGMVEQP